MSSPIILETLNTFEDLLKNWNSGPEREHYLVNFAPFEVKFRKELFEEDFVEPGQKAELVGVEEGEEGCTRLFFYFGNHEKYNLRFFKRDYNIGSAPKSCLRPNALDADMYDPHYDVILINDLEIADYFSFVAYTHSFKDEYINTNHD